MLSHEVRIRHKALHDWLVVGLYAYLLLRVIVARAELLVACVMFALVAAHFAFTETDSVMYRIGLTIFVFAGYPVMGALLPSLELTLVDAQLLMIDEHLFGETLAATLQPLASPGIVEWFAFFYFSYYLLLPLYGLPIMAGRPGRKQYELIVGVVIIACVAYASYTLVPAVGPMVDYPFEAPLAGGFWWRQVERVVDSVGAQIDIFPSLHTAFPVFFALHAFRHQRRSIALVIAVCAANITVATVLLRWHYGIDTIAGLALALIAFTLSSRICRDSGTEAHAPASDARSRSSATTPPRSAS